MLLLGSTFLRTCSFLDVYNELLFGLVFIDWTRGIMNLLVHIETATVSPTPGVNVSWL